MKNKLFYYPLLVFLFCVLFDKVLYFEVVQHSFIKWNRFEMIAYKTREALFELYRNDKKPKIVLLGSSKLASIQRKDVENVLPNFSFYNFCVPLPSLSYLLYVLERLESIEKPKFLLLELDLLMFTYKAEEYPFRYALPFEFFFKYFGLWSKKELGSYLGKSLFLVGSYPISLSALYENNTYFSYFKEDGSPVRLKKKELFQFTEKAFIELIQENHGGIRIPYSNQKQNLKQDATEKWKEFFQDEVYPQNPFLAVLIQNLREEKLPFIVVLSPSSIEFEKKLAQNKQVAFFDQFLKDLSQSEILDLRNFQCRKFEDSFHLQGECIHLLSYEIIHRLSRQLK